MTISIGFSPCPNDTFIFDALINGKIDTGELRFEPVMEDVQTLNEMALQGTLPLTKISFGTLPLVAEQYLTLNAGGALGTGVGPLLVSPIPIPDAAVKQCLVAIPGRNTTAHVLFSLAFPEASQKVFLRYDEIEDFVLQGPRSLENIQAVRAGVIIHENRFTYAQKGLVRHVDLGEFWEKETGHPIPLGGIIAQRSLPTDLLLRIEALIRESIRYSFAQGDQLSDFVKANAREMDEQVMWQHIRLYVNDYSTDLGEAGRAAVRKFVQTHSSINKLPVDFSQLFLA